MGLQTPSAPWVLSLAPSLGTLCSIQWMAVSIHFCFCQALGEPFRRQLYQALISKLLLAAKIVFGFGGCIWDTITKHMKLKKKDQSVDTSILLRRWNKIPMEGVRETKCEAETEGITIQGLPHLGIHPINSHQTQTLLDMPARFC